MNPIGRVKKIESANNPLIKKFLSLTTSRGIRDEGQCLVSGEKIIKEFIPLAAKNPDKQALPFWITESLEHSLLAQASQWQVVQVPTEVFKQLDTVGTHAPLLCTIVPKTKTWSPDIIFKQTEVLCALGDPNNLGALLRSALGFGFKKIILLKECCHPFHPRVIKASAGAVFHLEFFTGSSIQELSEVSGLVALDVGGTTIDQWKAPAHVRLLLGEEGQGLPNNLTCKKIAIPIDASLESLNATVAASIVMYHLSR